MSCPLNLQRHWVESLKAVDRARKMRNEGRGDELVKVRVFHGFRSNKSRDEIKEEGLDYYHTSKEAAESDIKEFLDPLGVDLKMVDQWEREDRWNIWVSAFPDAPCDWARRSPEAVMLTIDKHVTWEWDPEWGNFTRVKKDYNDPRSETRKTMQRARSWRDEKYGRPMMLVADVEMPARRVVDDPPNINLGRTRIEPEEIVEVYECPPLSWDYASYIVKYEPWRSKEIPNKEEPEWWTKNKWKILEEEVPW